jgi:hypothetical protein
MDSTFSVSRDPNCLHPKIMYSPNGDNVTGVPCDYPGDTVTCEHCNGTNETYICTKHCDLRLSIIPYMSDMSPDPAVQLCEARSVIALRPKRLGPCLMDIHKKPHLLGADDSCL